MEHITFSPKGVCSVKLDFDLEDGKLHKEAATGISRRSAGWSRGRMPGRSLIS